MIAERDSIERLYLDYTNSIDDNDLDRWQELFTEDCSYRIASAENVARGLPLAVMRCDSRAMLADRVEAIRSSAFYVSRTVRHFVSALDVRPEDEETRVRANFAVYESLPRAASTLLCVGRYDDVVVTDREGIARFRQKHCIYDGDLVVDSIVYPL